MNDTAEKVVALEQPVQNGVRRPFPGTKTGLVFDYADKILAYRKAQGFEHFVPLVGEVLALYANVADSVPATGRQQFQHWCTFHGLKDAWKARVAAEGVDGDAAKAEARKAKEAAKLKKAQEAAAKAADRVKKMQEKAAAALAKAQELVAKAGGAAAAITATAAETAPASTEGAAPATDAGTTQANPAPANGAKGKAA